MFNDFGQGLARFLAKLLVSRMPAGRLSHRIVAASFRWLQTSTSVALTCESNKHHVF